MVWPVQGRFFARWPANCRHLLEIERRAVRRCSACAFWRESGMRQIDAAQQFQADGQGRRPQRLGAAWPVRGASCIALPCRFQPYCTCRHTIRQLRLPCWASTTVSCGDALRV